AIRSVQKEPRVRRPYHLSVIRSAQIAPSRQILPVDQDRRRRPRIMELDSSNPFAVGRVRPRRQFTSKRRNFSICEVERGEAPVGADESLWRIGGEIVYPPWKPCPTVRS